MIFAANWKMNLDNLSAVKLAEEYNSGNLAGKHQVIVMASHIALADVRRKLRPEIEVYAQDVSKFSGLGNFTGETSAQQLHAIGVSGCLLGHMERRTHVKELDSDLNLKIKNALNEGLKVMLSVGETSQNLTPAEQKELITSQLATDLADVTPEMLIDKLAIAFESVATISSFGNQQAGAALPVADIFKKIAIIKDWLKEKYAGVSIPVIYGGSVAPDNIAQFVTEDGVGFDGFLVGKKSLDVLEFKKLLEAV